MRRLLAVLSTAALSGIALAGCTPADEAPAAADASPSASSPAAPGSAATARDVMIRVGEQATGKKSASFTVRVQVGGRTIDAAGKASFGDAPAAEVVTSVPTQGQITIRVVGGTAYAQVPAKYRALVGGKAWVRGTSDNADLLAAVRSADPSAQIKALIDGGDVAKVGTETVDGVETTHYAGTVAASDLVAALPADQRATRRAELSKAGVTEVRTDFWVDAEYLPRRSKSVTGGTTVTTTYSDWGVPVTVEAPPAADTADLPKR